MVDKYGVYWYFTYKIEVNKSQTIFQRTGISEPALFSPSDTTKRIKNFPEICISTFSDNIIIPVSAVRDEGTSYHYIAPSLEIEADAHSIRILENVLTNCGYPYVKGKTWTSDAIYRETLSAIGERRQEGCLAAEMECASMLATSKYRHIPFIQFLYGADNLSSETWEIRDLMSYGLTNAEKYMVLAFECGLAL